jgi:capsid protein
MKQFQNVIKYAESCDNAKKLVEMAEDYAKTRANEMFGKNFATYSTNKDGIPMDKDSKAKQLNDIYCEELKRRSKYSVEDFDGDVRAY